MDSRRHRTLTRRSLLTVGGAVTIGIVGLISCSGDDTTLALPQQTSDPNIDARERAGAMARQLRDRLMILAQSDPDLAEVATLLADRHSQQLDVLGAEPDGGSASTGTAGDTAIDLVATEREAATAALSDIVATGSSTAALLAQVAASDTVHADLLASAARVDDPGELETPTSTGVPSSATTPATVNQSTLSAWSRMLDGEYAAVYAFGVVTARVPSGRRSQADADWAAHRRRRDDLVTVLAAAGATVPTALPAYDLGPIGDTGAQAIELAARVETATADLTAECLPLLRAADRLDTATALVAMARRAVGWSHTVVPLPDFPTTT